MLPMKRVVVAVAFIILISACGGSASVPAYAEDIEALITTMNARLDQLDESLSAAPDLDEVKTYYSERVAARDEFLSAFRELDVPESALDLHTEGLEILSRLAEAERLLSTMVAGLEAAVDIDAIWSTPEGLAARKADARAILLCEAAEENFDSTSARAEFADVPWIPQEMKEVIRVAFGCHEESR